MTSVDLPPPETPVTQVNVPSGKATVRFCRLLARAPTTVSAARSRGARRRSGRGICRKPGEVLAGQALRARHHLLRRAARHHLAAVHAGARPHVDQVVGACGWRPRRARRRSPCCRCRAAASAPPAAGRCRAGAGRSTARRARRARRSAPSRSARPAGCAGSRRRTACPRRGRASGSRGRRCRGSPAAR